MICTFLHNDLRNEPCSGRTDPFLCFHRGIGRKGMGRCFIQACQCGRCYIPEFFCLFLTELALPVVKTFQGNAVLPAPFLFAQRTAVGFKDDLIPLAGTDYSLRILMEKLGLLRGDKLTNAGRVLFSKRNPIVLKLAVFATEHKTTFLDIARAEGNVFRLIDNAMGYIIRNIRWKRDKKGKKKMKSKWE